MPRLEDWSISNRWNEFQSPLLDEKQLSVSGVIYDDEFGRFEDGERIITSSLRKLDINNNYAQTLNTKYTLGIPSDEYLKWLEKHNMSL